MSEQGKSLMDVVQRVLEISVNPMNEWGAISSEKTSITSLYWGYIIPLAAIGPIASVIGVCYVGINQAGSMYRLPLIPSLSMELVTYLCTLVGVFLLALLVFALAPLFGGQKDLTKALRLAAYSYTPAWLAGLIYLAPDLALFGILLSFYSLYVLYVGLPIMMQLPENDPAPSAGLAAIVAIGAIAIGIASDSIGVKSYSATVQAYRQQIQQTQREAAPAREQPPPVERVRPARRTTPNDQRYEVPELPEDISSIMRR